ncbi:MAG: hypothetical protein E7191_02145 [Erysipelotrichaceae bacterium]|nr:hypothetical protein [Erysipelotrichaceae bacterium]
MKKLCLALLIGLLALSGCTPSTNHGGDVVDHTQDPITFKSEYEEFNGSFTNSGKEYLSVEISEDNPMYYASYEEVMEVLESGTGVIYFGYPTCPWCRNVVEVLTETAKADMVDTIYYFNAKDYRDVKKLKEDGSVEITTEAKDGYYELVEALGEHASVYEGLNDDSIKRLYFPTVVFVKEGEILLFHEGSVDSQEDPYVGLNEEQRAELKKIYHDGFVRTFREVCDSKC